VEECDVVVIGGGIVGLSTARALTEQQPGLRVLVLEKEDRLAQHQTGRNSGVIHSGIYYPPGSSKARYALAGARAMYEFCEKHGLPARRTGKLIVATSEAELGPLATLEGRAKEHGLECHRLGPAQIREHEPHITALAALHVPITGVADFAAVAQRYAEIARENGAEIRLGSPVATVADDGHAVTVEVASGAPVRAKVLVNCAGLFSDRIARAAGGESPVRILPFRGEYYELAPAAAELVRGLVYPVPDPAFPFLGVHLTRGIDGVVHAGPNAVLAFRREGYRPSQVNLRDLADVATYRGFWRLARKHWRAAVTEYSGSLSKRVFAGRVRRMLPDLRDADLVRGPAGVRAQAVGRDGRLIDDFLIVEQPHSLHVLNAPSPAATASLPIGNHLAQQVVSRL
jgi:L-2-hydroxyglutarate oxidase